MTDLIHTAKLQVIFNRIDNDLSGRLDLKEVESIFQSQGIKVTRPQISKLVSIIDKNKDEKVDFNEFKTAFQHVENMPALINQWKSMIRYV